MLIVFSPIIPHFTCECWDILRPLLDKRTGFNTERSILEQKWPQVDKNWEIELNLKVNRHTNISESVIIAYR